MESHFDKLESQLRTESLVTEANNPTLHNYNGLPEPFTEVKFKKDALKDPYLQGLTSEFKSRIENYIKESESPDKKYRLLISAVTSVRNSMDFAGSGAPVGHLVQLVEQEGPVTRGHFTVPLSVLEIQNAAWNANQAPVPNSWRYDRFKHRNFADMYDEYNKGMQPNGTFLKGGNN